MGTWLLTLSFFYPENRMGFKTGFKRLFILEVFNRFFLYDEFTVSTQLSTAVLAVPELQADQQE